MGMFLYGKEWVYLKSQINKFRVALKTRLGAARAEKLTAAEVHAAIAQFNLNTIPVGQNKMYSISDLYAVEHQSAYLDRIAKYIKEKDDAMENFKKKQEEKPQRTPYAKKMVPVKKYVQGTLNFDEPDKDELPSRSPYSKDDVPDESNMDFVSRQNLERDGVYYN